MAFAKKLFFTALFLSLLMEAGGTLKDPWSNIDWYFHADIKSWLPASGIILNPLEITMIVILIAWALRGRRAHLFRFERGLLYWPMLVLIGVLVFGLLWGAIQPGDNFNIALWEIRSMGYCIIAYFLVGILFTHRRDLNTLIWVILVSAFLLGIECLVRYWFFLPGHVVGDLDYDHDDATILAFAILLSLAMLVLGCTRRQLKFALISLPVEVGALLVTHRRAGEAALAIGIVALAIILLRVNKRLFLQVVPATALVLSVYLAAYWNCTSNSSLCQPARALTSQINPDPRDLASDQYRYIETQDLIFNIDANPLTGRGFGQQYIFYIQLPDESFWPFWHYTPHNSVLWVWVKGGIVAFFAFWWLVGSGLYRGGRLTQALNAAGDKNSRALLASAVCFIIMQISYSYVDLGLMSDRMMLLFGIMFGVIGHLPTILRRSATADEPAPPERARKTGTPATETPEEQVGALAHVLVSPAPTSTTRQRTLSRPTQQRTLSRPTQRSNWGQSEGAASWRRYSRPLPQGQTTDQALNGSYPRLSQSSDRAEES
jgi:hypothetical protein